jgi:ribonuclease J
MAKNVNIATNLGYLTIPEGTLIRPQDIAQLPDDRVVILSTGSQGEPMSALARMASRDHPLVEITPGDTVVISAKPVPGNERSVWRTINRLFAAGADVIYEAVAQVHVSGHAAAEELKMILNLVRPQYFVPVHGEYRHLHFHAQLARATGVPDDHVFILENGDVLEFTEAGAFLAEKVEAGMIFVDGLAIGDFRDVILRDRHHLATDGIAMVVLVVQEQDGVLAAEPELVFRGFAAAEDLDELSERARRQLVEAIHSHEAQQITDVSILKAHVHDTLQRFLYRETRRRPMIMPVIVEV